ncbi:MAG: DMT family transporter [Saprospiraceae bacterium]|nr:DMT family transporter [Saprospiraceae bacterium]
MFFPAYLFCLAQERIPSTVAGILNSLTPAFALLISVLFYKFNAKLFHFFGLIIGLISAILLSFERSNFGIDLNSYSLLIVLATLSYGTNINLVKYHLKDINSISISFVSVAMAGILSFLIFYLPNPSRYIISQSNLLPFIFLCTLGIMGTSLAQVLFNRLIEISTPLFAGSVTFLIPIIALGWGIWDGEIIGLYHLACIFGIILSIYLIRKS